MLKYIFIIDILFKVIYIVNFELNFCCKVIIKRKFGLNIYFVFIY